MKMGIFDFLKRSEKHELIQDEREAGGETTAFKASLKRLRAELEMERLKLEAERDRIRIQADIEKARQDLEDLQADYEGDDQGGGSTEDAVLTTLLTQFLSKQQAAAAPAPVIMPAPAPAPKQSLEDQQIENVWRSLSKEHQKIAKRMNDGQLKAIIEANLPGISDESLERAVAYVRKV